LLTPVILHATDLDTTLWPAGLRIRVLCLAGWPWLRWMDQANAAALAEIEPRVALLQRAAIVVESSRSGLENLARQSTVVDVPQRDDVVTPRRPSRCFLPHRVRHRERHVA
jgi:hypothetical protein